LFCQVVTVVPDLVIVVVSAASNQRIQFEMLLGVQNADIICGGSVEGFNSGGIGEFL
jgi:hypothetical protein